MTNFRTAGEVPECSALCVQNESHSCSADSDNAITVSISDIHNPDSESVHPKSDAAAIANKTAKPMQSIDPPKNAKPVKPNKQIKTDNINKTGKSGKTSKPHNTDKSMKADTPNEISRPDTSDKAPREPPQINEFQFHLSARNLSDNTIVSYSYAIRQFFKLYGEITHSNLKLYKLFLIEHYRPMTVNLRIRALNYYIEYCQINSGRILRVRVQQKNYLDNVISEADYEYLKNCLLRDHKYLYYYIIRFMAATGARVSEVVQFTAEDIFAGHKDIYSKDNKIRRIYVPKMLQRDTLLWMKSISLEKGYIFLNRYGNPIKPGGIRYQLRNLADRKSTRLNSSHT